MPDRGAGSGPVGVGIIGAGNISSEYLANLIRFPDTRVVAIGDIAPEAARAKAAEHGIARAGDVRAVLDDGDVELVVDLTVPTAHAEVGLAAIAAGKHLWNEKPLTTDRPSAAQLLDAAARAGLRVGGAPDTFLGSALQTARRLLDDGAIGIPHTAIALMTSPGPDAWHPNPAFFFQLGAGPLFDIGPYYLTALVQIFGAVSSVAAAGSVARPMRVVGSGPLEGETFPVGTPSHVGALLRFAGGQSAQAIFSFDAPQFRYLLEITGTEGALLLPDPNLFGGEICIRRPGGSGAETLATTTARSTRGTGVLEMARAIRAGRPHRASGELTRHVLDTMVSTLEAERALAVGLIDQADRLFGQVVAADPRNSIAMVGLARVALERGDERGAYVAAKRALAIDPDNPMASHMAMRMAEILRARGETLPAGPAAGGAAPSARPVNTPGTTGPAAAASAGSRRRPGIVGRILRRGGTR